MEDAVSMRKPSLADWEINIYASADHEFPRLAGILRKL
jgi:hypothetical protein